jgi:hypothetical protein
VTTLPAKAGSFSGHAPPIGARSVLTARSEPQNILRGVQVSIGNIPTGRAVMHPIRQCLRNVRQRAAPATHLCRVVRRNCDHCHTSFFRFVRQDMQERSPRDIQRGFGQPTAGDTTNVQVFVDKRASAVDQRTGGFMMKISPQIADSLMLLAQQLNGLCTALTALVSSCDLPLRPSQRGLCFPVVLWWCNDFSIRRDQESFQTQIDTDGRANGRRNVPIAQITRKDHIQISMRSW